MVEQVFSGLGIHAEFERGNEPWLHPGAQARARVGGTPVAILGELHPDFAARLALEAARPLYCEIDLAALPPPPAVEMAPLPRFPAITRDLAFFVREEVLAAEIAAEIERNRDPLCVEFRVLDDFRDPKVVPPGQKSMLWTFTYRAEDRTLTDGEVESCHEKLIGRLSERLQIARR
jgi:phenylalanyl-tRNA synthetase beta chain